MTHAILLAFFGLTAGLVSTTIWWATPSVWNPIGTVVLVGLVVAFAITGADLIEKRRNRAQTHPDPW